MRTIVTDTVISMKTSIIKSLLTSPPEADQREGRFDRLTMTFVILSLSKDGKEGQGPSISKTEGEIFQ